MVGGVKKNQRIVSGVGKQITRVESVLTRTVFARGMVGWVTSNPHVTARSTERQGEGNLVFKGVEVEVQVVANEVDTADMGKARMWRNKDMRRC